MTTTMATNFEVNSQIAGANRAAFALDGVTAVSLVGPAGSGKTTVIEAISRRLRESMRIAAVIGNRAATRDAARLARQGIRAVAVQTYNLTASDIRDSLAELDLARTDLVFIESDGNDLSPVESDLGQDLRIAVFDVAGGDGKAAEYAELVSESDLVVLSKIDLLPFINFDFKVFSEDLTRIRPSIERLDFSARIGCGVDALVHWLASHWSPDKQFPASEQPQYSEWFQR